MTEPEVPEVNENGKPVPPSTADAGVQGQAAVAPVPPPIAEDAPEPKWRDEAPARKKRGPPVAVIAIVTIVLLGLVTLVGWRLMTMAGADKAVPDLAAATGTATTSTAPEAKGPLAPYATGALAKLNTYETPRVIESIPFQDRNHKPLQLSDYKGQVVVLNLWATWCSPCRFEMPTLARLQTLYDGKAVKVLPLSVDREEDFAAVKSFMDVQQPLEIYLDPNFEAQSKYKVSGLPATLILDKQGRLVARLDGETKWDTPEVQALLDKLLAE